MSKDKRRQYGSGGLHRRSVDGRWYGSVVVGYYPNGRPRRVTRSAATEAEARRKLEKLQREIARTGAPVASVSTRTTIRRWSEVWLERHERTASPKYYASDASAARRWIVPTIGRRPLASLTPADVRAVTDAVTAAGRTSTMARQAHGLLLRMLRAAVLEGHPISDRVLLVPPPPKSRHDRTNVPLRDALDILRAAAATADGSRWLAALLQGMRQSESLGLTWTCIDWGADEIDVSWQLQRLPYKIKRDRSSGFRVPDDHEARQLVGGMHLVLPKTKAGRRVLPLLPPMRAALEAWRGIAPASPHGLVWPRPDGSPQASDEDDAAWYALQDAAQVARVDEDGRTEAGEVRLVGRRYLIHEARHTTGTLLLEAGVDESVRVAIMGHSSIQSTRAYQHVSSDLVRAGLEEVAARLELTTGT